MAPLSVYTGAAVPAGIYISLPTFLSPTSKEDKKGRQGGGRGGLLRTKDSPKPCSGCSGAVTVFPRPPNQHTIGKQCVFGRIWPICDLQRRRLDSTFFTLFTIPNSIAQASITQQRRHIQPTAHAPIVDTCTKTVRHHGVSPPGPHCRRWWPASKSHGYIPSEKVHFGTMVQFTI